ncbi:hypothetical protein E2C01_056492 [Portunus trituberculatus]|uniref:Uncharacterized protein n=1 Tax=Portunus trituberculatus TaxID=210409 RepID=A0A5B7GZB5_PORTR|nr:hypothetical protein [Portunus trituberculatus]
MWSPAFYHHSRKAFCHSRPKTARLHSYQGLSGVGFAALALLVPVGKEEDGRTSPFGSDNLPHQRAVVGCLTLRWEGWLKIGAEMWILDILREGYRIPFSASPPLTRNPELSVPTAKDWLRLLGHLSSLIHLVPGSRRRMPLVQVQLNQQ